MSDINLPSGIVNVNWQEEKPAQDGEQRHHEPPAEKVTETYEESSRTVTDKITILGIPIDLMTTQVQAAIAGLVAEVDHLKARNKRYEKAKAKNAPNGEAEYLIGDAFIRALDKALAVPPPSGYVREFVMVVVNTYEDIRRSSGLLSANSALADVAARVGDAGEGIAPIGLVGGPTVAALLTKPEPVLNPNLEGEADSVSTADLVRQWVEASAYTVAGLDMSLRFTVASVRVQTGQSALHAIGQTDHVLRS